MATYKEIQDYIKYNYKTSVKSCWIAHMKEKRGLKISNSPNRIDPDKRKYPCPEDKQEMIIETFKKFEMI